MSKEVKSLQEDNEQGIISYVNSSRHIHGLSLKFLIKHNKPCMSFQVSQQEESKSKKELGIAAAETGKKKNIRICLVGHCAPGLRYLVGDFEMKYHYKVVADHVVSCLEKLNASPALHRESSVKISIIACNAGIGEEGSPSGSFAESLYLELLSRGINADVVARVRGINIRGNALRFWKETVSFDNESKMVHHQPGSKVIFTLDEKGQPIFKDAYAVSWKIKVMSAIQNCAKSTNVSGKKKRLTELYDRLKNNREDVVLRELEKIFGQKNSFIDNHKILGLGRTTHTRLVLKDHISEGIKFIRSPHTIETSPLKSNMGVTSHTDV